MVAARRVVRVVVLSVLALLGAVLGAPGVAAAAPGSGSVATVIGGVPARVADGGGFTAVFTVRSTSRYRILVDSLFLRVASADDPSGPADGVSVEWQDPATGTWRTSDTHGGTGWGLTLSPPPAVEPRGTLTFRARIGLDAALPGGGYAVETDGVADYRLLDAAGRDAGTLDGRTQARAAFRYDAAAPSPSAPPSPSPSASASPSATASASVPAEATPEAVALPSDAPPPPPSATPSEAPSADAESTPPTTPEPESDSPAPALAGAAPSAGPPGLAVPDLSGSGPGHGPVSPSLVLGLVSILAGFLLGGSLLVRRGTGS
ncbi:hypothetical protein GCM10009759_50500 [Kitasatospora saccharophila]|uniref:Uncharacterized protein n=1 Tax=Kitasatospora saccharophila TaxID=407973 RepID=A0ABN2XGE9_9ACTN